MGAGDTEVTVIGGGAAGVAAARHLWSSKIDVLIVEARQRLGGRAFTFITNNGFALDLGCGWLHSAERNPWGDIAKAQGRHVNKSLPPWMRPALPHGFSANDQRDFAKSAHRFYERLETAEQFPDRPASELLEPGNRWNNLINAVNTFISGGELTQVSAWDLARYQEGDENWRVVEGYGTIVAAHGAGVPAMLDCPVQRIDHSGKRLRIETAKGAITADQSIIAVPTPILANPDFLSPSLPEKTEAARALPLGFDDKLFLSLDHAEEFEPETRLFGRVDRPGTGAYHLRPFGRPVIEAYFGGALAANLEAEGDAAFFSFAQTELADLLGTSFRQRIKPIAVHRWGADPFAGGAYSYALPGKADLRAVLAAPVDQRLFFAGEACSRADFSTAHGALLTGIAAADQVIAARRQTAR